MLIINIILTSIDDIACKNFSPVSIPQE